MIFKDRFEAGRLLASKLLEYKDSKDTVVIALPRGGVPLGYVIAKELNLPFDIFFVKKIPSPYNKEVAIGAVSENGYIYKNDYAINMLNVSESYLDSAIREVLEKIKQKRELYNIKPTDIKNKRVILVDDGIATGSSVYLAIEALKKMGAKEVIVATPVAPSDAINLIKSVANRVVVLHTPANFMAVGAYYEDFHQLGDNEVIELLNS